MGAASGDARPSPSASCKLSEPSPAPGERPQHRSPLITYLSTLPGYLIFAQLSYCVRICCGAVADDSKIGSDHRIVLADTALDGGSNENKLIYMGNGSNIKHPTRESAVGRLGLHSLHRVRLQAVD